MSRLRFRHPRALIFAALLLPGILFFTIGPRFSSADSAATPGTVGGPVLFGASTIFTSTDFSRLTQLEQETGRKLGVVNWFQSFPAPFLVDRAKRLAAQQRIPMVTWQPALSGGGLDQPDYQLADITAGRYDSYIRSFGAALASVPGPVWLRFAPEMNGDWETWSEGVNGNLPGDFVAAWQHVHDVVTASGETNIKWVWAPNVPYAGTVPMTSFYPGDAYVDLAGLDGYNFGSTKKTGWRTYDQVFGAALAQLAALTDKPVVLAEVASVEDGGSKPVWVKDFLAAVGNDPAVVAFVWFDMLKGPDWRIDSTTASAAAFKAGFGVMSRPPALPGK